MMEDMVAMRSGRRWWLPAGAAGVLVVGSLGWAAASANSTPSASSDALPSAEELLTALQQPSADSLTGTVVTRGDLGLPDLPGAATQLPPPLDQTADEVTVRVWVDGMQRQRLTFVDASGLDAAALPVAQTTWTAVRDGEQAWLWNADENTATRWSPVTDDDDDPSGASVDSLTPAEAAAMLLSDLDPDTEVSVAAGGDVAGRPTADLVLTPRDDQTLVEQVVISVDRESNVPLRVTVRSVKVDQPAFESGFTAVDFAAPAAEVFDFTPPAGATVEQAEPREGDERSAEPKPTVVGEGWSAVAVLETGDAGPLGDMDATTFAELDEDERQAALELLRAYLDLPTVNGEWGSGRLVEATLFSAIITDDGRVAIGAVPPELLESALG